MSYNNNKNSPPNNDFSATLEITIEQAELKKGLHHEYLEWAHEWDQFLW